MKKRNSGLPTLRLATTRAKMTTMTTTAKTNTVTPLTGAQRLISTATLTSNRRFFNVCFQTRKCRQCWSRLLSLQSPLGPRTQG